MVMISPCAGCDASVLAYLLAIIEAISGLITIIKSTWWWWWFRRTPSITSTTENDDNACSVHIDVVSNGSGSEVCEANVADNVLWMLSGVSMGSTNIILAAFFLVGVTNVNYVILVGWCLTFPLYYILDCILLTLLLKHCTSKERFEKCRTDYIYSTIFTFIFHSYVLWVAISVIHWCNCRRDPYKCRFSRDYCHSFNLNFSSHPFTFTKSETGTSSM